MRIAFVSFEYPPDSAFGGIATYVLQVTRLLADRGHDIEVFCSSPVAAKTDSPDGFTVHRIKCDDRLQFHKAILKTFSEVQHLRPFDVIESPEYFGDALSIKREHPSLPVVVKLHTPRFLIHELTFSHVPSNVKMRFILGGLLRGKLSQPFWKWNRRDVDIDYELTRLADQVHTPSVSLGNIVSERWNIPRSRIFDVPYPFIASNAFLDIPVLEKTEGERVFTFIGRLEIRKGIIVLVEAAKKILNEVKQSRFRLIGRSQPSHIEGLSMKEFILQELKDFTERIDFFEVQADAIPQLLATSDVCVFPSIWENFPNVCLEAMSAGRAIVGSSEGGMKEMLTDPEVGVIVDPNDHKELATAVIRLLLDAPLRKKLGDSARQKVLARYNNETIGTLMETYYEKLIKK